MAEALGDPPIGKVFQESVFQPIRELPSSHVTNSDQSEAEFGYKRADQGLEPEWTWRKTYPDLLASSIQIDGKTVVFHPNYSSGQELCHKV